jgi:hypothetical protein
MKARCLNRRRAMAARDQRPADDMKSAVRLRPATHVPTGAVAPTGKNSRCPGQAGRRIKR